LRRFDREGVLLALTQTQLASAVADRAEITTAEAKRVLGALEEIVLEELDNAQRFVSAVLCS
jgi:nucleoid DNA-binding protein